MKRNYLTTRTLGLTLFFLLYNTFEGVGQYPRNIPHPDDTYTGPFDNWPSFILYIVLPVLIIILYLLWRRRQRQRKDK